MDNKKQKTMLIVSFLIFVATLLLVVFTTPDIVRLNIVGYLTSPMAIVLIFKWLPYKDSSSVYGLLNIYSEEFSGTRDVLHSEEIITGEHHILVDYGVYCKTVFEGIGQWIAILIVVLLSFMCLKRWKTHRSYSTGVVLLMWSSVLGSVFICTLTVYMFSFIDFNAMLWVATAISFCIYLVCAKVLLNKSESGPVVTVGPQESNCKSRFCGKCGKKLIDNMNYCQRCGTKIKTEETQGAEKCQICDGFVERLTYCEIKDDYGTRYRSICDNCIAKYNAKPKI